MPDGSNIDTDALVRTNPVLGGRVGIPPEGAVVRWHLFGSYDGVGVIANYAEVPDSRQPHIGDECTERTWLITPSGISRRRNGGPLLSLPVEQITVGLGAVERTIARLRVKVGGFFGRREFFMDCVNPVEVTGSSVTIVPFAPAAYIAVNPNNLLTSFGTVIAAVSASDELATVAIQPIEESRGLLETPLTNFVSVAANTQVTVQLPPYAKHIQIFQNATGAPETSWGMFIGDPVTATGVETGTIPFLAALRATDQFELPGEVTHLRTGPIDVANARLFTVRYTIRP